MDRLDAVPACLFRGLWKAWGRASKPSLSTFFVNIHLAEIKRNFVTLTKVRTTFGRGAIRAYTRGLIRDLTMAPAMESGGGISPLR